MTQFAHDLFASSEDRQRGLRAGEGRGGQPFKAGIWPVAGPTSVQYEMPVGSPMMPAVVNGAMIAARRPAVRMAPGWSIRKRRAFLEWNECHWRMSWNVDLGEALAPQTRSQP